MPNTSLQNNFTAKQFSPRKKHGSEHQFSPPNPCFIRVSSVAKIAVHSRFKKPEPLLLERCGNLLIQNHPFGILVRGPTARVRPTPQPHRASATCVCLLAPWGVSVYLFNPNANGVGATWNHDLRRVQADGVAVQRILRKAHGACSARVSDPVACRSVGAVS